MADAFDTPWRGVGVGGSIALDFANTLDWRGRETKVELLTCFPDLVRFARTAGLVSGAEAERLRRWAAEHPRAAAQALARAVEVREAIAAVFQALARGFGVPDPALAGLERAVFEASAARTLRAESGGARWAWRAGPTPDRPAWALALEAVRLLEAPERERVRECGDEQCGWLFLDTSRNGSRRWCSMRGCGNRNKVRAFHRRAAARRRRAPRPRAD